MTSPDETPLLLLLVLAERHLAEALQQHLVAAGFHDHRLVHHRVMAHVSHQGIRLTELADKAGVTKQAMSELVADLERLGYLERAPDPADGRAKLIRFTTKGRAAVQAAMEAFEHMQARLGDESVRSLQRGLRTALATSLGPSDAPGTAPAVSTGFVPTTVLSRSRPTGLRKRRADGGQG